MKNFIDYLNDFLKNKFIDFSESKLSSVRRENGLLNRYSALGSRFNSSNVDKSRLLNVLFEDLPIITLVPSNILSNIMENNTENDTENNIAKILAEDTALFWNSSVVLTPSCYSLTPKQFFYNLLSEDSDHINDSEEDEVCAFRCYFCGKRVLISDDTTVARKIDYHVKEASVKVHGSSSSVELTCYCYGPISFSLVGLFMGVSNPVDFANKVIKEIAVISNYPNTDSTYKSKNILLLEYYNTLFTNYSSSVFKVICRNYN